MYIAESLLLGVVATVVGAPIVWFLARSIQRFRSTPRKSRIRREVATGLWRAAGRAPVAVAAIVEYHDPVWFGPDLKSQTADSMIRYAALRGVISELESFGPKASALGWRSIGKKALALHDACDTVWNAWRSEHQNTDADIAATRLLSQDLELLLSRRRYRHLIAADDSAQTPAARPA